MHSQSTVDSQPYVIEDDYVVEVPTPSEKLENLRKQVQSDSDQRNDKPAKQHKT